MADVQELNINDTTYDIKAKSVVDQNSGSLKMWTGTHAEYNAIVTKDANTLYNITDDSNPTLSMLELLYPVGAVYFGTMSVCPLQALGVGTWQALPQDKVIQIAGTRGSVGDTLNESLPNITGSITNCANQMKGTTNPSSSGALSINKTTTTYGGYGSDNGNSITTINLDASLSSSTYQDNAPVQQDAYLLNGWRRIS